MDVMTTPGAFSWAELLTGDPAQAADFYSALFGWSIEAMDMPMGKYYVAKLGDVPVAGMAATAEAAAPSWGVYVTVADVEQTVAQCVALGATVLLPIHEVPHVGRMACIRDPQGASLSVISYFPRP